MNLRILLMIVFILLAVVSLFFYFQSADDGRVETYYPDGKIKQLYFLKDGSIDGIMTEYYQSGKVRSEIPVKNGDQTGWAKFYYETGEIERKSYFISGVQVDTTTLYHKNGSIKQKMNFANGKPHGRVIVYYPNGDVKFSGDYKEGGKYGNWIAYDSIGGGDRLIYYRNDTLQSVVADNVYHNLLDGYDLTIPEGFHKMVEFNNQASFSSSTEQFGPVTISVGSKDLMNILLKDHVEKENDDAKRLIPDLNIITNKMIKENEYLVECAGTARAKKFFARLLISNNNNRLMIFSVYVPSDNKSELSKMRSYTEQILRGISIQRPQIVIE